MIHRELTRKLAQGNGTRTWEATVPLLSAPDHTARRFATWFAKLANGQLRRYDFAVATEGGGTMQGQIDVTDKLRNRVMIWLNALPMPANAVLQDVAQALRTIEWTQSEMVADVGKGRVNFGINIGLSAPSADAAFAYMFATVLNAGYGNNIRCCPKKTKRTECGKWFVDFPTHRDVKKYCTTDHQKQHATYLSKERAK